MDLHLPLLISPFRLCRRRIVEAPHEQSARRPRIAQNVQRELLHQVTQLKDIDPCQHRSQEANSWRSQLLPPQPRATSR